MKTFGQMVRGLFAMVVLALGVSSAKADDVQDLLTGVTTTGADAQAAADVRTEAWKKAGPVGAKAVAPLGEQLTASDPEVAKAAYMALDNIVDYAARPGAEAENAAVAAELAKLLDGSRALPVRQTALRLLALGGTDAEIPAIASTIGTPELAQDAVLTLEEIGGKAAVAALAEALPTAPAALQARIAASLGRMGIPTAAPALKAAAKSDELAVRWASLEALGRLGVPPGQGLKFDRSWSDADKERFNEARLKAAGAVAEGVAGASADPVRAANLYKAVARTGAPHQVGAAMIGLAALGSEDAVMIALGAMDQPKVRVIAVQVLSQWKSDSMDATLKEAYVSGTPATKAAILEVAKARASSLLADMLAAAKSDSAAEVRLAAATSSGEKPSPELLYDTIADGSSWGRDRAAEALLTVAAEAEASDGAAAAGMYERLVRANLSSKYKTQALQGIERLGRAESLPLVDEMLGSVYGSPPSGATPLAAEMHNAMESDPGLASAAGRAYVAAHASKGKEEALATVLHVLESTRLTDVASLAVEKLAEWGVDPQRLARSKGFITTWKVLGPFPNPEMSAYQKSFIPESGDWPSEVADGDKTLTWQDAQTQGVPAILNFKQYFRETLQVAAYAAAEVKADADTPVLLLIGSDDGCEVWLNGQRVFGAGGNRPLTLDGDRVEATLKSGVNRVLVKGLQGVGDWQCVVRIANPDGTPLDLSDKN